MASSDTLGIFVPDLTILPNSGNTIENVGISIANPELSPTTTTFAGPSNLTSFIGNEGDNTAVFQGKSRSSFVDLEDGDDTFIASNVGRSSVDLGDGDNTLTAGPVSQAVFTSGSGNDEFTVTGNAKELTIDSGAGDDTLIFGGDVRTSTFLLGDGADSISFAGSVRQTTIDLGGEDGDIDTVSFTSKAAIGDGVVVTGAGDDDVLRIGGDEYEYDSGVGGFVLGSETITFG
jgi:hypothetical protein